MGQPFGSALELRALPTTPAAPPSGSVLLYFHTDGLLYKRDASGTEVLVGGSGGSTGSSSPPMTISPTAPANPQVGDRWLDPASDTLTTNFAVSATNPGLINPGLWVQTGLGADGTGITFWIEDGT